MDIKGHDAIEVKTPKCGNFGPIVQEAWQSSNSVVFKKANHESKCQTIELTDPYFVKPTSEKPEKPHFKPEFTPEELKNIARKKELIAQQEKLDKQEKPEKLTWQEREILYLKNEIAALKKELARKQHAECPKPYVLKKGAESEEKVY